MGTVPSLSYFRPLRSAHWALPVAVVAGLLLVFWGRPCREGPYYPEVIACTLFLTIVVWANHLGAAPIRSLGGVGGLATACLKDFALLLGASILASVPLAIITPAYQCYTDRAKGAEVVLAGSSLRLAIEQNALSRNTLVGAGRGVEFRPNSRARWGAVTNDGQIVVVGEDPPVVFTLTPTLVDGSVTWTCRGFPRKFAPMVCRGKDET